MLYEREDSLTVFCERKIQGNARDEQCWKQGVGQPLEFVFVARQIKSIVAIPRMSSMETSESLQIQWNITYRRSCYRGYTLDRWREPVSP